MKAVLIIVALLFLVSLPVTGCGNANGAPASTITTETIKPAIPEPDLSYDALLKGGFVDPAIPRITAEDLKFRLDKGEGIIIIDTRSDRLYGWYEMGHLPGAINIHYAIDSAIPGAEEKMDRELEALPNEVLKVLYCN